MPEWKKAGELAELAIYFEAPGIPASKPTPPPSGTQSLASDREPASVLDTGESTRFFIEQAGVRRRNPVWKFGIFGAALIGLPAGVLILLSAFRVVPLEVTRVDESGTEITESVFSAGGVSGLKDALLGKRRKSRGPHETSLRRATHVPAATEATPEVKPATQAPARNVELGSLYQDKAKRDLGPRVRQDSDEPEKVSGAGLKPEEIHKVVDRTLPAFQNCIEVELRRNPGLRGGSLLIAATVASSGIVKEARIDRRDIEGSHLGDCLRRRARGMVFRPSGEETDIEIPLKVIKAL